MKIPFQLQLQLLLVKVPSSSAPSVLCLSVQTISHSSFQLRWYVFKHSSPNYSSTMCITFLSLVLTLFFLAMQSPIEPLRLLVPTNYPYTSPIFLDKMPVEVRWENKSLYFHFEYADFGRVICIVPPSCYYTESTIFDITTFKQSFFHSMWLLAWPGSEFPILFIPNILQETVSLSLLKAELCYFSLTNF